MMQAFRPVSAIRKEIIDIECEIVASSIGDFDMDAACKAISDEINDAIFTCGEQWLNIHIDIEEQGYYLMGDLSVSMEYKHWDNDYNGSAGDKGSDITRISVSRLDIHVYNSDAVEIPRQFEANNIEAYIN